MNIRFVLFKSVQFCHLSSTFLHSSSNGITSKYKYLVTCHSIKSISKDTSKSPFIMKINSPEFNTILSNELISLVNLFHQYNYEIRIAGGAVRDILLEKTPSDIDFATNATPDEMKDMFSKEGIRMINAKGEKHGTITARINNQNFEVTTLRIDVTTDGRHAEVEFTKDWELDANRRDFTINSMFLGSDGTLYDYCNGCKDLNERRVVFVGDAKTRIIEDYLRILRYFRFYGKVSEKENAFDEDTLRVIADNIDGLARISGERIWVELKKILVGNYSFILMSKLIKCGAHKHIGLPVNPDINSMQLLFDRIKGFSISPVTIICSLFDNTDQFRTFIARCKLSKEEKNLGLFIIEKKISNEPLQNFKVLLLAQKQPSVTREQITELFKYQGQLDKLNSFESWSTPILPINGNDLLTSGVPPGKALGFVMAELKLHWISSNFMATREELLHLVPTVSKRLNIQLILKNY